MPVQIILGKLGEYHYPQCPSYSRLHVISSYKTEMICFPGYPWVDSVPFSASNHTPGFIALQWSSSFDKKVRAKLSWRSPSLYTPWSLYLSCQPHPETSGRILGYFIRWFRSALMMNISVSIYIGCAVTFDSVYCYGTRINLTITVPDSKVRGPTWGPSGGDRTQVGPHVGPMNFAIWGGQLKCQILDIDAVISFNMLYCYICV